MLVVIRQRATPASTYSIHRALQYIGRSTRQRQPALSASAAWRLDCISQFSACHCIAAIFLLPVCIPYDSAREVTTLWRYTDLFVIILPQVVEIPGLKTRSEKQISLVARGPGLRQRSRRNL